MKRYQTIKNTLIVIIAGITITTTSCKKSDDPAPAPVVTNTITDKVVADLNLTLLKQAVIKANLATTLSGSGPFTVFAPDDAAFISAGFTSTVIASAAVTPAALSTILLYHTLPAKYLAAQVPAGPNQKVVTASGDSVFVTRNSNGVFVNGVKVTIADIAADNGVIHKVGRVILPPSGTIAQTAVAAGLDSLVKALSRDAGLLAAASNTSSTLTVFAPSNAAFRNLLVALNLTDINQIPLATLSAVLKYHIVGGRAFSSDLTAGSLTMFGSGSTTISLTGPTIKGLNSVLNLAVGNGTTGSANTNNTCNISGTDIMCRNGVVHLIDRVLLP